MTTSTPSAVGSVADRPALCDVVPQTLLLLGASGDLAARLLLPGLGRLVASGTLPDLRLIGSGMDDWDDGQWRRRVADSFAMVGADGPRENALVRSARYLPADVTGEEDLRRLLEACQGQTVIFFALPPVITARAAAALARIGLPAGTRLMLEKPFGTDVASARSRHENPLRRPLDRKRE